MTPDGWKEVLLGEIVDLRMGGTPARKEPLYWDREKSTQNRWVAISDMKQRLLRETSEYISDEGIKNSPVKLIEAGTPLMSFKLTIGKATIPAVPVYTNEAIVALEPTGPIDRVFLYYAIPRVAKTATASVAVKGKTLNKEKLRQLPVLLPPLREQRKIAAILSSVDEVTEKTEAVVAQLQIVKSAITRELLTRGMPGRHSRYKQTEIGSIPEDWRVVTIGELLRMGVLEDVQDGNHGAQHPKAADFVSSGIPFVMARDLRFGTVDLSSCSFITRKQADGLRIGFARPGDVLLSHKGTVGRTAVVPDGHDYMMMTPQVTYYRIGNPDLLATQYLYHLMQGPEFQRQLDARSRQSTRSYIGITKQRELLVPLPDLSEQIEIGRAVAAVEARLVAEEAVLEDLLSLKAAVMSVLLTGDVRVAPNGEAG